MNPRQIIVDVAKEDLGLVEIDPNFNPEFKKFWDATWYSSGLKNREPYCAAAVTYWVTEADKRSELIKLRVRPQYASVRDWTAFAMNPYNGATIFDGYNGLKPEPGDLVIYRYSHIGVVASDFQDGLFETIEANTSPSKSGSQRDGDGIHQKRRSLTDVKIFVRLPCVAQNLVS